MRFVTIRDLRLKPGDVWKLAAKEKNVVLTANGHPVAILTGVTDKTFEEELEVIQRARVLKALDNIHRDAALQHTHEITDKEIQAETNLARKGRKK
ncbi:MAG: type II toxin-antitoxin system Phd/YefM family antitoxin [Pseudomonadota bacterium]